MPDTSSRHDVRHPRPLRNKVDPRGDLHPERMVGSLMGNRGILHDANDWIVRKWATRSWVCCSLDETSQKRSPFTAGTYSELFFLDEATAYAAGHRPCRACRRAAHDRFNAAWTASNPAHAGNLKWMPIRKIDAVLHAERVDRKGTKRTYRARVGDLPVGAMFAVDDQCVLVAPNGLRVWSFHGYAPRSSLSQEAVVDVLTPPSVVAAIRHGLTVDLHATAS